MRLSLAIVLAAGALVGSIVGAVYGAEPALVTAALVTVLSAAGVVAAHWVAGRQSLLPLQARFDVTVGAAVGVVLITVLAAAKLMFVSNHDALMLSAIVLGAALIALRTARVASAGVVREVGEIRDALTAVGDGARDREVRATTAVELTELARAATQMIDQLAEEERRRDAADAARRSLVASISHDLRTPLAALRLMLAAIEDGVVDDSTRDRYLATMHTHVRALGSMVDDLFELSRVQAGELDWSIRQVELPALVDETVAAMRIEAEAKGVAVAADLKPLPRPARADPERLQRVRERLFEPFVRGLGNGEGDGAGLGLALCRAIVEAHGGQIWLADSERGTRVRFVIPT